MVIGGSCSLLRNRRLDLAMEYRKIVFFSSYEDEVGCTSWLVKMKLENEINDRALYGTLYHQFTNRFSSSPQTAFTSIKIIPF